MDNFVKERNEAFASMDKDKILSYCKKYDVYVPEDEEVFWIGVHKTVCNLFLIENSPISIEQYNKSYEWLTIRGYSPNIINPGGEK